jgi:hypothetical protein
MIFSCAVSFESKKLKIPDLSLPPCIAWGGVMGEKMATGRKILGYLSCLSPIQKA